MLSLLWLTLAFTLARAVPTPSSPLSIRSPTTVEHGISNVHLDWSAQEHEKITLSRRKERTLDLVYADCSNDATLHDTIASAPLREGEALPARAVWTVREDLPSSGCLYARVDGEVVARSEPVEVVENEREVRRRKRSEKMKMADLEHYGT